MGVYEPRAGYQAPAPTPNAGTPGTRALIEFEGRFPGHTGPKEEAIRVELRMSSARYYQLLQAAAETREALELDPITVHRIRDKIAATRQRRTNRSNTRRAADR